MKFSLGAITVLLLSLERFNALVPNQPLAIRHVAGSTFSPALRVAVQDSDVTATKPNADEEIIRIEKNLEWKEITDLSYRNLQKNLKARKIDPIGTTAVLRDRLQMACGGECVVDEAYDKLAGNCNPDDEAVLKMQGFQFVNKANPSFEFDNLVQEIMNKSEMKHWKAATRKLKKLKRYYSNKERPVPEEVYISVLRACMDDRLSGARASIPARRIMEEMADDGYFIPGDIINYCVDNSLGYGKDGTHDTFGGIDCALAMAAVAEQQDKDSEISLISEETYGRLVTFLAKTGDVEYSTAMLKTMITQKSFTPTLGVFADIAISAAKKCPEKVMNVLILCKAAGYELDKVASTVDGRTLLAAGVISAEKMNNDALGLRLLTAAQKAAGCEPDRGDDLVCSSSSFAQRAATLIHRKSINKAVQEGEWKLAVKLMEKMIERSLKPSPVVWRSVVTCCGKNKKSRKATALLLDWVKLYEEREIAKPPLAIFNTVLNACEICDEHELTFVVLEAMKKTYETDGTIITFNIALKRLAREGNVVGCEGIIIGMLEQGIEPIVVSYTTAIGACAAMKQKNSVYAYEWLKRMRSREVQPNLVSYNTALAACLDGKLESSALASKIAAEMLVDIDKQIATGVKPNAYTNVIPNAFTKSLTKQAVKQLRQNWRDGDIDMTVAKATIRTPLLELMDFDRSKRIEGVKQLTEHTVNVATSEDVEGVCETTNAKTETDEMELEYSAVISTHRTAEV